MHTTASFLTTAIPFLVLLSSSTVHAQCMTGCTCFAGIVRCKSVTRPLAQFDANINQLTFEDSQIGELTRDDLSRYTKLADVELINCSLTKIDVEAFRGLTQLGRIHLESNSIGRIEGHTFRDLNLDSLVINKNPGLQLSPGAFVGLKSKVIDLSNNGLTAVGVDLFTPTIGTLKSLILNGNQLTTLPMNMKPLLDTLEVARLDGNPFKCDCALQWLLRDVTARASVFYIAIAQVPTCASPAHVAGRKFTETTTVDFCHRPEANVTIAFEPSGSVVLTCYARGHPAPKVTWTKPSGVQLVFEPREETETDRQGNVGVITLNPTGDRQVDVQAIAGVYRCTAFNNAGSAVSVVNLTWPIAGGHGSGETPTSASPQPCISHNNNGMLGGGGGGGESEGNAGYFHRKQFSLLELIFTLFGGIVGSIVVTTVILHCCVYKRRRLNRRRNSHGEESGLSGPPSECSTSSMAKIPAPGGIVGNGNAMMGFALQPSNNPTPTNANISVPSLPNGVAMAPVSHKFHPQHAHQPSMDRHVRGGYPQQPNGQQQHNGSGVAHYPHAGKGLFDENHYMTTNVEEQNFLPGPCDVCQSHASLSGASCTGSAAQPPPPPQTAF